MADQEDEYLFKITVDGAERSIKNLADVADASKALREERKKLDLTTEDGKKRLAEINSSLDLNNKVIKENVSTLEKQRLNIGNYTGALDKLVPGLGATINGITGMTKASLAFIATPIGLVLTAIVAALALLSQYFTRTEAGGDLLTKRMDQLSAVFNVLLDRAAMLGGALMKLFTGDFKGAAEDAGRAVSGVTDEIEREVKAAGELADILDQLEDRELSYSVAVSETANQVKNLIIQSKNRALAEEDRIKLLEQAANLEKQSNEEAKSIALQKLEAANKQIELDFNQLGVKKEINQSEIEFAKSIVNNSDITVEARKKVADALIEYNKVQGDSLNLQEKIANMIDANAQREEAASAKRIEQAEKERQAEIALQTAKEQARQREIQQLDQLAQKYNAEADAQYEAVGATAELEKESYDLSEADQKVIDKLTFMDTGTKKLTQSQKDQALALQALSQSLLVAAGLFEKNSVAYKLIASAQSTIDAWRSYTLALATFPPPFGAIAGGISLAAGLAAVAKINAAAGGGSFMTSGPTMLIVGDNPGGVERVDVTPISGKGETKIHGPNLMQMAGGGSLTTMPSFQSISRQAEQQLKSSDIMNWMKNQKIYLAIEDYRIADKRYTDVVSNSSL